MGGWDLAFPSSPFKEALCTPRFKAHHFLAIRFHASDIPPALSEKNKADTHLVVGCC